MMGAIVYLLCTLTSGFCALLLLRGFWRQRTRLLLWSGAAFAMFTISNALLFVDLILLPDVDLSALRNTLTLAGVALLLWGLVWESSS